MAQPRDDKIKTLSVETRLKDLIDVELKTNQNPIVYSSDYDVTFAGIEKWYPLDTCKGGNVFKSLKESGLLSEANIVQPKESTYEHLSVVHSMNFLENINLAHLIEGLYSSKDVRSISRFSDIPSLALLPSFVVNTRLLRPLRFQTGGSVLAAKLALEVGWSINLGGGLTHCYSRRSGGFSPYADVTLTLNYLLEKVNKVMIIDLSAQQCNGPERGFMYNKRVHILDVYNRDIYPLDGFARRGISGRGELENYCSSQQYLDTIRMKLEESLEQFQPDFVLYLSGVDVLRGDLAGCMNVTEEPIIERDQLVFLKIRSRGIPLAMLLGGGFSKDAHSVISKSIINLQRFGLVTIIEPPSSYEINQDDKITYGNGYEDTSILKVPKNESGDNLDLMSTTIVAEMNNALNNRTSSSSVDLRHDYKTDQDDQGSTSDGDDDHSPSANVQNGGFMHRSKTFMGSFLSWTGWSKPEPTYHSLSQSECLSTEVKDSLEQTD